MAYFCQCTWGKGAFCLWICSLGKQDSTPYVWHIWWYTTCKLQNRKLKAIDIKEIKLLRLTCVHAFVDGERINQIAFTQRALDKFVQLAHFQCNGSMHLFLLKLAPISQLWFFQVLYLHKYLRLFLIFVCEIHNAVIIVSSITFLCA